jgi:FkbM family methyltransferase
MIKHITIKILKKILHPIIIKLGYTTSQKIVYIKKEINEKNKLLEIFFTNIKEMGFVPQHIIDVGANHGTWTREAIKFFPDSYYTLIEPQSWLESSIRDLLDSNLKISFNPYGAGAKSGSFMFTLADRDDSCSFRFSEEEANIAGFQQIEIPIITLNEIVKQKKDFPFPDLVKIDAEGLDIEVLEGASELMGKTEIFLVEAAIFQKKFDNDLLKMVEFMKNKGYVLFDITDLNRPFNPQVLWLVELAFVKKGGVIDSYKFDTKL